MIARRPRWAASTLGGLLLLAALAGAASCGKSGNPVAPEWRVPAPPAETSAAVEGPAIVLSWANPRRRVDGSALRDLQELKVFRREEEPGAAAKPAMLARGGVVGYEPIATIRLASPAPALVQGNRTRLADDRDLTFGRRYVYVVTATDASGRSSAPSPRTAIIFLAAPGPPRELAARPGDRQVTLTWQPPAAHIDGQPVTEPLRYLVLRAVADGPLAPITPAPIEATAYTDADAVNDTDYRYAVAAVRGEAEDQARGEASPPVAASPARTTPPEAPTGLVVIPTARAMRLAWNEVPDPELARYAVYRAAGGGPFERIGTTPSSSTVFVDRDVEPGRAYRYAVTAVDSARRPNESPRSNEVSATAE